MNRKETRNFNWKFRKIKSEKAREKFENERKVAKRFTETAKKSFRMTKSKSLSQQM
jgi:hypothetical protein